MKRMIPLIFLSAALCHGGIETWTSKEGRKAEMELVKVTTVDGEKVAEFKTRNGQTVTLKASQLAEESSLRLSLWTPPAGQASPAPNDAAATPATTSSAASVFDKLLDGNLEKAEGKSVKRYKPTEKPEKFYVFYYSASWCGPCHQYTPSLAAMYNKLKPANKNFEVVLITKDSDEKAMENYVKEKAMPWPVLKMDKAAKFTKEFNHEVRAIPAVVVCKLDGTVVAKTTDPGQLTKILSDN